MRNVIFFLRLGPATREREGESGREKRCQCKKKSFCPFVKMTLRIAHLRDDSCKFIVRCHSRIRGRKDATEDAFNAFNITKEAGGRYESSIPEVNERKCGPVGRKNERKEEKNMFRYIRRIYARVHSPQARKKKEDRLTLYTRRERPGQKDNNCEQLHSP